MAIIQSFWIRKDGYEFTKKRDKTMLFTFFFVISIFYKLASTATPPPNISNSIEVDILKYGLPCPLQWVDYTLGSTRPKASIPFATQTQNNDDPLFPLTTDVIARTTILGEPLIGNLKADGFAYFYSPKEGKVLKETKCQILTNPKDCSATWAHLPIATQSGTLVQVRMNTTQNVHFVGKARNQKNEWQGCNLAQETPGSVLKPKGIDRSNYDSIQALQSVTKKLSYIINSVSSFEQIEALEVTFSGTNRILNKADVEVSSSVSYGVSASKQKGTDNSRKVTTGSGNNNVEVTTGDSEDEDKDENMDVSQDLNVPAFTSIETCSSQKVPGLVINFLANVTYFSEGLDADKIEEILSWENFTGPFVHSDNGLSITASVRGEVREVDGKLSSTFWINPVDVVEELSCVHFEGNFENDRRTRMNSKLNAILSTEIISEQDLAKLIANEYKTFSLKS